MTCTTAFNYTTEYNSQSANNYIQELALCKQNLASVKDSQQYDYLYKRILTLTALVKELSWNKQ